MGRDIYGVFDRHLIYASFPILSIFGFVYIDLSLKSICCWLHQREKELQYWTKTQMCSNPVLSIIILCHLHVCDCSSNPGVLYQTVGTRMKLVPVNWEVPSCPDEAVRLHACLPLEPCLEAEPWWSHSEGRPSSSSQNLQYFPLPSQVENIMRWSVFFFFLLFKIFF